MTQQAKVQVEKLTAANTRDKILDAAEALIVEHGYAGTSLRAITQRAGVNLAAAHYHFGSKKGLFSAVFHRRIEPVRQMRQQALETLIDSGKPYTVKDVIRTFLAPLYQVQNTDLLDTLPSLVGRIYGEPESVSKPILEAEFSEIADRYQAVFCGLLPRVPAEEIRWRFHFMIGSMIQTLRFQSPLGMAVDREQFINNLDRLVEFTAAGMQQLRDG